MRRHLLLNIILLLGFCASCAAQFNFYKYSFGVGAGLTLPFGDTRKPNYSLASQIVADYYFTPYIQTGVEFQFGNMRGGEYNRANFHNTFWLTTWNAKMQLGQFYDRYDRLTKFTALIRGLYAGIGVGVMHNTTEGLGYTNTVPVELAKVNSVNKDIIFPLHIGINFYFKDFYHRDRWELNFNMQYVSTLSDNMDGNISPRSNFNDIYNYFSSGIRYKFGTVGLDKRRDRIR